MDIIETCHMYFLALYLAKKEIDFELLKFVVATKYETDNKDLDTVFSMLKNAPDLDDPILRSLVLQTLS